MEATQIFSLSHKFQVLGYFLSYLLKSLCYLANCYCCKWPNIEQKFCQLGTQITIGFLLDLPRYNCRFTNNLDTTDFLPLKYKKYGLTHEKVIFTSAVTRPKLGVLCSNNASKLASMFCKCLG